MAAVFTSGHYVRIRTAVIYRLADGRTLALMDLLREIAERQLAVVERILRGPAGGEEPPEPVSRDALAARLAEGSVTLLDVRPADEFAAGHIPGAINVAPDRVDRLVAEIDRDAQIVAYCRGPGCIYAHQAVAAPRRHGLDARRLDGGLPEGREDGRAVAISANSTKRSPAAA